ncbi:UNVERIFIED_CONTAM: hypothetical protein GTU68_026615 [Idotea baltica]|nr:hypothetical protein [Idotea baltica]
MIGKAIVQERLAACGNILSGMQSIYWWEGELVEDNEVVLIAKTTDANFQALMERIKMIHSYDVPCIISLPITDGNPDYFDWIKKSVDKQ